MGRSVRLCVMEILIDANQALGASPEEAFALAFVQVMIATEEELELLVTN